MWILTVSVVAVAVVFGYLWFRYDPRVDDPIDAEQLASHLESMGVEISSTRSPSPEILTDYIGADEAPEHAIHGKYNRKNAVVCLLGDRLVLGAATVGTAGVETRVIPYAWVERLEKDYDRGGTLRMHLEDEVVEVTHLPRSQFEGFEAACRERIDG